jgi:alpha-galactosidase
MQAWKPVLPALVLAAALAGPVLAAPPTGGWIFDRSPDMPGFRRVVVSHDASGWHGKVTSAWYGDLDMQSVRTDGDAILFQLFNGNKNVPMSDIVLKPDGAPEAHQVRMTGKLWDSTFDITAHAGTPAALKALDFPADPLPPHRVLAPRNLAPTPPMGWSSWNKFADAVDDKSVRQIADALVSSGLRDAGYVYVNIDDGWQGQRDASGVLQPNAKFPNMKALADYVHARGLKLGIYTSPGPKSCAGYEGSYGHVQQDAQTYADWGIDYLKYDLCSGEAFYHTPETAYATYQAMGEALVATKRDIVLSLCEYGRFDVGAWGRDVGGNLWRTTGDIEDNYATMAKIGFDKNGTPNHTGPNGWNDPDMLEVGNGGMTHDEYQTHLALWAMLSAPLILGNDVRAMTPETLDLLKNREVIAIDQDPAGIQGLPAKKDGAVEIWTKSLADGSTAVGIFNRGDTTANPAVTWADLGLKPAHIRDLWNRKDLAAGAGYAFVVPKHGVVLLRVMP